MTKRPFRLFAPARLGWAMLGMGLATRLITAANFPHICRYFDQAGLTLVGMEPNDAMGGNHGYGVKVIAGPKAIIANLQNPDARTAETANASETAAACRLPGFESIPFHKICLYRDPFRRELP